MEETELQAPDQLFEYVTEDEYARLVRERQSDGFILDDGGSALSLTTSVNISLCFSFTFCTTPRSTIFHT